MTSQFGTEALMRAMAPIDKVIDALIAYAQHDDDDESSSWSHPEIGQTQFAAIVSKAATPPFVPTRRYLRLLLTRYASKIEREAGCQVEDELAELIAEHAFGPSSSSAAGLGGGLVGGDAPDPDASGYISFQLPRSSLMDESIVGIRVYPHHNDVGIRKVWEAGACLAEYLVEFPDLIKDKMVIELGAGVGLTGIVAAGLCQTKHLHMTDYTPRCLDNMEHNIKVNLNWLQRHGVNVEDDDECNRKLTSGFLEWSDCVEEGISTVYKSRRRDEEFALTDAEVLLAADVVYDSSQIPSLVRSVKVLLNLSSHQGACAKESRMAIFATTFRNEKTFAMFTNELNIEGISCEYVGQEVIASLPSIFPCYFTQPRSDVRICIMTAE